MALSNALRKRKYIEKIKASGLYEAYKKKKADQQRQRMKKVRKGLTEIGKVMRDEILNKNRAELRKKMSEYRIKKKHNETAAETKTSILEAYRTSSALSKAFGKVKRSMPKSLNQQAQIVSKLFHSFDENVQLEMIRNKSIIRTEVPNAIGKDLVEMVEQFYQQDDISRMSPDIKHSRYFRNPVTGEKEIKQVRHLMFTLKEVYNLFITENFPENSDSNESKPPIKISKFCDLRPAHVRLAKTMPHNVCYCLYHSNFIECCDSLHKNIPVIPKYGKELTDLLLCENPTKECWTRNCERCSTAAIKTRINDIFSKSNVKTASISWIQWKKDEDANRLIKNVQRGSIVSLIDYFISILDQFLKHSFTKRAQASCFEADRKELKLPENSDVAVIHMDYAENFTCEGQDEVQSAHWNQKTISVFTIAQYLVNLLLSKAFVSDNTDHSKSTIIPFLYKIFVGLPKTVKTVKIWSDGPTSQFKNKYIASIITLFESLFPVKIFWNFFATSHGKGWVDGIGAVVKSRVKRMVLCREAIVNCAQDFVTAFNSKRSSIDVIEVTPNEIREIYTELELDFVFDSAKQIKNISSHHQLQVFNEESIGFPTSKDGYNFMSK